MWRPLDPRFSEAPIAHRGLHDRAKGVIENSATAIRAAVEAGYGVEIDLQLSADGEAMVFHDDELMRVTDARGPVRAKTAAELGRVRLDGGRGDTVPTFAEILELVAGRVPLLVEAKDQHGAMGSVDGRLEQRAAALLAGYAGPVAVMSFNPHSVAAFQEAAPEIPRGRVTCDFDAEDWPMVDAARRRELARIDDLESLKASFISHQHDQLDGVRALKATGLPILCWTIKSAEAAAKACEIADNITFEGYLA